jgi:hypothetical protein
MNEITITVKPWAANTKPYVVVDPEDREVYVWAQQGREELWSVRRHLVTAYAVPSGADPDDLREWLIAHKEGIAQIMDTYQGRDDQDQYGIWAVGEDTPFELGGQLDAACDDSLSGTGIIRVYQDAEAYLADSMPQILAELGDGNIEEAAQNVVDNVLGNAWLRQEDVVAAIEKAKELAAA